MRSSFQAAFPSRISAVDAAPELPGVTPQQILDHNDSGDLWPMRDGPAFNELQSAYGHALAVRRLRIARGEVPVGLQSRLHEPHHLVPLQRLRTHLGLRLEHDDLVLRGCRQGAARSCMPTAH